MPVDVQRPHRTATLRAMLSVLVLSTLTFVGLANHFRAKDAENPSLSSLSSAWIDRQSCAWFHKCGVSEPMVQMKSPRPSADKTWMDSPNPLHAFWTSGTENASTWDNQERKLRKIPDYVMKHAPYVHLYSGEGYWPCDMAEHLLHTTPHVAFTPVEDALKDRDLDNLDELNKFGPVTFLQSDDNIEDDPDWLGGESNIPSGHETSRIEGKSPSVKRGRQSQLTGSRIAGGRSDAPAVLLVVDKGDGIVDAFWFFFYSYNLGNAFLGIRFGNHVGDWEHTAVRFRNGQPTQVFFSEHAWGQAFSWDAVEKIGDRPISYSASGTHAMYARPGTQEYVLPFGLLYDRTDRGPLWDPTLNMHSFTYNHDNDTLRSSELNPQSPVNWFYFWGHWGDKSYPDSDPRQYKIVGQRHYVSGPLGPRFKNLGRKHICQDEEKACEIQTKLKSRVVVYDGDLETADLSREEEEYWRLRNEEHELRKKFGRSF